jgi:proline dehydrogenase
MLRATLLGAANNRALRNFVTRHGLRLGARRFVAGESLDEFLNVVGELNMRGFRVAAGFLGEDIRNPQDAERAVLQYQLLLARMAQQQRNANVALKLTQLGLAVDTDLAFNNVSAIVRRAEELGNFVRIDMEQSGFVGETLDIYRKLRQTGHAGVGAVLQSYLYRSQRDLESLLPLAPNLRIVKGAYLEPAAVAFRRKSDVDRNYVALLERSLQSGGYTAIATHDRRIIDRALAFIRDRRIGADRFEFQMLYGVRPRLQAELLERGFSVRVAVPFGSQWYPYLMRRLAERPANLFFFLRSLWP